MLTAFGAELRFNTRSSKLELRHDGGDWRPLTERPAARLRERIAEEFDEEREQQQTKPRPLRFADSRWRQAVNALVAEREIDPFVEALEALPQWDGVLRLDRWLDECFVLDAGTPARTARLGGELGSAGRRVASVQAGDEARRHRRARRTPRDRKIDRFRPAIPRPANEKGGSVTH